MSTIPTNNQNSQTQPCGTVSAGTYFHAAFQQFCAHATKQEIAIMLYQKYSFKSSFDNYYARIRKCFSTDPRESFLFCDAVNMMAEYREYAVFYALCDFLGFERPKKISADPVMDDLLQQLSECRAALAETERQMALRQIESAPKGVPRFIAEEV